MTTQYIKVLNSVIYSLDLRLCDSFSSSFSCLERHLNNLAELDKDELLAESVSADFLKYVDKKKADIDSIFPADTDVFSLLKMMLRRFSAMADSQIWSKEEKQQYKYATTELLYTFRDRANELKEQCLKGAFPPALLDFFFDDLNTLNRYISEHKADSNPNKARAYNNLVLFGKAKQLHKCDGKHLFSLLQSVGFFAPSIKYENCDFRKNLTFL